MEHPIRINSKGKVFVKQRSLLSRQALKELSELLSLTSIKTTNLFLSELDYKDILNFM